MVESIYRIWVYIYSTVLMVSQERHCVYFAGWRYDKNYLYQQAMSILLYKYTHHLHSKQSETGLLYQLGIDCLEKWLSLLKTQTAISKCLAVV